MFLHRIGSRNTVPELIAMSGNPKMEFNILVMLITRDLIPIFLLTLTNSPTLKLHYNLNHNKASYNRY